MKKNRFPLIDALRGFSVLLVVLLHLQLRIPFEETYLFSTLPHEIWSFLFKSGNNGVRIFFVISGFLITTMTLKRWQQLPELDVKQFYLFRFARIAPPLFLLLAVLAVLHFNGVEHYTINPERASYGTALFAALTFHINWLEGQVGYLPGSWDVLWSLSVEEVFYLFFPAICIFAKKPKHFFAVLALFILIGPFYRLHTSANEIWSTKAYLSCMDSIAIGCITALTIFQRKFYRHILTIFGSVGALLMSLVLLFKREEVFSPITSLQLDEPMLSIGTALVLIYCVQANPKKILLSFLAPFIWYGRLSYEIYLTHMFVVFAGVDLYKKMGPSDLSAFTVMALVVLVSGLLGYTMERYYSEPLNQWIRKYEWPFTLQLLQKKSRPSTTADSL